MDVVAIAQRAHAASRALARTPTARKNSVLEAAAAALLSSRESLLQANRRDLRRAEKLRQSGKLSDSAVARLKLSDAKLAQMATGMRQVARLDDPAHQILFQRDLDDGLTLQKVTTPFGVLAAILEARPDAVVQLAALAIKSGNALILKAGAEARDSTRALMGLMREALAAADLPADALAAVEGRQAARQLLSLDQYIALVIPRGGTALVRYVQTHTTIPVLGHADGVCHVYVDAEADPDQALAIVLDSKVQAPSTCNAAETILVHKNIAPSFLPRMLDRLTAAGVKIHGSDPVRNLARGHAIEPIGQWHTEFGGLEVAVHIVDGVEEAIEHIHAHGSSHTDAIVTRNAAVGQKFLDEVDSAGVYLNASTRFADGYRYGFGAEVGISTNRIHARGPVGLESLVSYKYKLIGHGHLVADYVSGKRHFHHELPAAVPAALRPADTLA